MTPQEAMAAALHAIGGFADDFPRPTAAEREDAVDLLAALAASGWTLAPMETDEANLAGFREGLAHAKATYGPGHRAAAIAEVRREVTALRIEPDDYRAAWQHNQTLGEVQAMLDRLDNPAAAQPAPDPLGPDDHGHTGRLWCDPCVGHGVMLEQGMHRCAQPANTVSSRNGIGAQPAPDPLREAALQVTLAEEHLRGWWREGEEVATVPLVALGAVQAAIVRLRAALEAKP